MRQTYILRMSDHITHYFTRVDAYVGELPEPQRGPWLAAQRDTWETRYAEFQRRIDSGECQKPGVSAFDYIETIAGLDRRLGELRAVA